MTKKPRQRKLRRKDPEFPGVSHFKDRHGTVRWRYRDPEGRTTSLGKDYGSPEFLRRYSAAVNGHAVIPEGWERVDTPTPPSRAGGKHTLRDLVKEWTTSAPFKQLADSTQTNYARLANSLLDDYGDTQVEDLTRRDVLKMMQDRADRPESANGILRVMRGMLDYASDNLKWTEDNSARNVRKLPPANPEGFYTWTDADLARFAAHWPEGTTADLAMAVMLYTGAARADAVQLGGHNLYVARDGTQRLRYRRQKMLRRDGVLVDIPVHPELLRRIDALPETQATFLETSSGKRRSAAGLGNLMRRWCDAAKLPQCTSHGLRKACARRLAEHGATPHEIMAVTGPKTLAEVERYTEKVRRAGLADRAMQCIMPAVKTEDDST